MNYILGGGGFSSKLVEEIRIKRGLAYAVDSFFDPGKHPGSFQIALQTKNASARRSDLSFTPRDGKDPKGVGVGERAEGSPEVSHRKFSHEIRYARETGQFPKPGGILWAGLDYPEKYPTLIRSITRQDILRVAKKYLHPENILLVVVANLKEAGFE